MNTVYLKQGVYGVARLIDHILPAAVYVVSMPGAVYILIGVRTSSMSNQ